MGFEPTEPAKVQRFSRPPDSTTLAPHRIFILPEFLIVFRPDLSKYIRRQAKWEKHMPKKTAGLLLFREPAAGLEVLLVHPGGPFWAKKDDGSWSIPKGEFADDEEPLAAAQREFEEELGARPAGDFMPLKPLKQPRASSCLRGRYDLISIHPASRATSFPWNGLRNRAGSASFPRSIKQPGSDWKQQGGRS